MVSRTGLICIYQGDDIAVLINVTNCDGSTPDLTGYTVNAQIRQGSADQSRRIAACFTPAIVLPNQVTLSLTHYQTTCLRNRNYRWDMEVISPDGVITTVVAGQVQVTPEVTRQPRVWTTAEINAFQTAWNVVITPIEQSQIWLGAGVC